MMRLSIEYVAIQRIPEGLHLEAMCKAPSCRTSPRTWSGTPDFVLSAVDQHVHEHLEEYTAIQEWLRGEHGVKVVR